MSDAEDQTDEFLHIPLRVINMGLEQLVHDLESEGVEGRFPRYGFEQVKR